MKNDPRLATLKMEAEIHFKAMKDARTASRTAYLKAHTALKEMGDFLDQVEKEAGHVAKTLQEMQKIIDE